MNSFFIPALSGQIYAMAGMQTHLNVLADEHRLKVTVVSHLTTQVMVSRKCAFKAHSVTEAEFAAMGNSC